MYRLKYEYTYSNPEHLLTSIDEWTYNRLSDYNKKKYIKHQEESSESNALADVLLTGAILSAFDDTPQDNSSSWDFGSSDSSSSDSSSFDGFDGGDFSGSGSSSDW